MGAQAWSLMGFPKIADQMSGSSLEIIRLNAPLPKGMMEYFNYQTGEGSGAHHIATMSAAPYLSFLLGYHRERTDKAALKMRPVKPVAHQVLV